jgi:hypothetical protein
MLVMQELIPLATKEEIKKTRQALEDYKTDKLMLEYLQESPPNCERQKEAMEELAVRLKKIDRAIALIRKERIRKTIEYRYIKGNERQTAILVFNDRTSKTLDRRTNEGITSIANSLKWME